MIKTKVDATAIARGLYEMFSADERACLAYGMLPAPKMAVLRKTLEAKFDELNPNPLEVFAEELTHDGIEAIREMLDNMETERQQEKKDWVNETEYTISVALYRVAPMVV